MKEATFYFAASWPEPWPPSRQLRIHEVPAEDIVVRMTGRTDGRVVLERVTTAGDLIVSVSTAPIRLVRNGLAVMMIQWSEQDSFLFSINGSELIKNQHSSHCTSFVSRNGS